MAQYDSSVIMDFADSLYAQAGTVIITYSVLGGLIGTAIGAAVGSRFQQIWLVAILGGVVVGVIALQLGRQKAFALKLQAQIALCQVQIEVNTRISKP